MKTVLVVLSLFFSVRFAQAQEHKSPAPALLSLDAKGLDDLREKSKGRVLVLNLWATWCKPCVEEFPELLKLQREYGKKGLDVIFVSIDDDAKAKQKVTAFLKKMRVTRTAYIKEPGDDETFINSVNPNWSGAVPATLIYDSNGRFVEMGVEELDFFELEKIVTPLLPY